ncbi:MAG: hypothetical protein WC595_00160 [Candidatus Nanoarchaeia archaeon]
MDEYSKKDIEPILKELKSLLTRRATLMMGNRSAIVGIERRLEKNSFITNAERRVLIKILIVTKARAELEEESKEIIDLYESIGKEVVKKEYFEQVSAEAKRRKKLLPKDASLTEQRRLGIITSMGADSLRSIISIRNGVVNHLTSRDSLKEEQIHTLRGLVQDMKEFVSNKNQFEIWEKQLESLERDFNKRFEEKKKILTKRYGF